MKICKIIEIRPEVINHYKKKFNGSKLNNLALKTYPYNRISSRIEKISLKDL